MRTGERAHEREASVVELDGGWVLEIDLMKAVVDSLAAVPMRFAYADPPYPGQAVRHYGPDAREVNHELLIAHLETFDAWALSTSEPALKVVLNLCPDDARVSPWVKPFASFKPNVNPGYCWEPVIWKGGRKRTREEPTVRDYVSCPITLKRGVVGAKPDGFCFWLFELVGLRPDDEFVDLFPGSGAVTSAWNRWRNQLRLAV